jgi:hypothetical protein
MEILINSDTEGKISDRVKNIEGWGYDADADNNPTYPMKRYNGADHERMNYVKSVQQPKNIEILHSNERPSVTRVFGTSTPPNGLSGALRRYAFKFSEGSSGHWLTLMLADRVNVVEGIVDDLKHGHIPNIFAERGWSAEWKYNRKAMVKKVATGVAVTAAVILFLTYKKKSRNAIAASS